MLTSVREASRPSAAAFSAFRINAANALAQRGRSAGRCVAAEAICTESEMAAAFHTASKDFRVSRFSKSFRNRYAVCSVQSEQRGSCLPGGKCIQLFLPCTWIAGVGRGPRGKRCTATTRRRTRRWCPCRISRPSRPCPGRFRACAGRGLVQKWF